MIKSTARFWLMKSEPEECSIDDALAAPDATVPWTGVRNYQARNFMRDEMHIGDRVLFYHSSCAQPGIVGLATVTSATYPDPTQFDRSSPYFDAKSSPESPRWLAIDVRADQACAVIDLPALRAEPELEEMILLRRGNRLSVMPVSAEHWQFINRRWIRKRAR